MTESHQEKSYTWEVAQTCPVQDMVNNVENQISRGIYKGGGGITHPLLVSTSNSHVGLSVW